MNFFTRLKLFSTKQAEKILPVDDITQLEDLLKKQYKVLSETKQKYYNSKGKEDYYIHEIEQNETLKNKAIERAKNAKGHKDEEKLKECFNIKRLTEDKITTYKDCLKKQKEISIKLNTFVSNLETSNSKLKCKIELLKTKNDFVQSVKDFKDIDCNNDINLDDVVKNIEINFNAKSYEFDDIKAEEISNEDFDDFVKEL